jgi:hypothetical protein
MPSPPGRNPVLVVNQLVNHVGLHGGLQLLVWCPGCANDAWSGLHAATTVDPEGNHPAVEWTWDGNRESPTIHPSILVHGGKIQPRCHSFIENGWWRYLVDCDHWLAGQMVRLPPLPDWVAHER